ncbi:type II toxin-antitoxin system VapC family toxin [Myxococcota bacterium]|nr:type II toxin-antitoxin system VapC family toxin [Myxococcota bacterium]
MPRDAVLDASAVLVLVQGETGADRVAACIPGGLISAVNLAEVVGKLADAGMPREQVELALTSLGLRVVPLSEAAAYEVGMMRPATRAKGLSLGDRACLALGLEARLPVLTADRAWVELDLGAVVEAIR